MVYLWKATVRGVIFRRRAISFIVCPSASSCSTSRWRGLSSAGLVAGSGGWRSVSDQPPGGQRRDVRPPAGHLPDRLEQLRRGRVLEQVADAPTRNASAATSGSSLMVRKITLTSGMILLELPGGVQAVEQGHGDVEDDDVGPEVGGRREQGPAVGHRPDHVALGLEQPGERLPEQAVVVRQQDARAGHGVDSGSGAGPIRSHLAAGGVQRAIVGLVGGRSPGRGRRSGCRPPAGSR